jgi:long-chain acyl-CoA synthetase
VSGAWLLGRMAEQAGERAVVWQGRTFTYADVVARVRDWHGGLDELEVTAGDVVVLDGGFSPNAIALLLALAARGAIAVPLTPTVRVHRDTFAAIAEARLVVEFDDADHWTVTGHDRAVTHALTTRLANTGHAGLIIFSSGSTGHHKAVLHDLDALLEKFRTPRARKTTLTFLLFDHIGGIDTLFNTLSSGGTVVTVPSRDPDVVCRAIAAHQVHTLPASPTFLNLLLLSEAYRAHDLSSLRVIAYGTEPMPEHTLTRLAAAVPGAALVQTYGTSEFGVLRSRSRESGSLWMQFSGEGFETKVLDGVLWVRTPQAMLGYLNAPDLFDEDGWLNTQDVVEVDGDYLRILGRSTDLINVGGQKVYPAEVENTLLLLDNVLDVAVYGEPNAITGQIVAVCVNLAEPEPLDQFKKRMRAFCRERLANYKVPVRVELTDAEQFNARFKKVRRATVAAPHGGS